MATAEPFRFFTRLHLTELTGRKASTLDQLAAFIAEAPEACIYHHTHRFFQEFQPLAMEATNDFASWVDHSLGEDRLGEELASIDIIRFPTLLALREKLRDTIARYLTENTTAALRFAAPGEEFHFMKSVSFILPTPYAARDLKEFAEALARVSVDSIYFHIFEARLRLGKNANDFSAWIAGSLGDEALAKRIAGLDPYSYSLEDLRGAIAGLVTGRSG